MTLTTENFLAHYGVLGMHWGVRKNKTSKLPAHPDHADAHSLDRKPINQLSNAEIKKLSERNQLEEKLLKSRAARSKIKKGENHVKAVLGIAGTATAAAALGARSYAFIKSPEGQKLVARATPWVKRLLELLRRRSPGPANFLQLAP
jgi:hypothetical protein